MGIAMARPATVNKGYKKFTVAKISDMNYKKSLNLKGLEAELIAIQKQL